MDDDTVENEIVGYAPPLPTPQVDSTGQRQSADGRTSHTAVIDAVMQVLLGTTPPLSPIVAGNRLLASREQTPRPQRSNSLRGTQNGLTPERRRMTNEIVQLTADLQAESLATQTAAYVMREIESRALQHVRNERQMFEGVACDDE